MYKAAVKYQIHALRNVFQIIKFSNEQEPTNNGLISKAVKQGTDLLNWMAAQITLAESSAAPMFKTLEAKDLDKPLTEAFNQFEACHKALEVSVEPSVVITE